MQLEDSIHFRNSALEELKCFFFFFSTLLQKRSQTNGEIIFELNLRQSHLNFVYNSSIGLLTVTLPDEIPAETWTHIGIQVRLPYLIQIIGVWTFEVSCIKWMEKSEVIQKVISITSAGLWKYHARLVRPGPISFRTSWKFLFTCPWTSKNVLS